MTLNHVFSIPMPLKQTNTNMTKHPT